MCTVSFVPVRDHIFITSNRDEKQERPAAILPSAYFCNGCRMFGPKDSAAGGTWIAMKESGDAAVLLNGAFFKHTPQPPYRQSRGMVFLDIFSAANAAVAFSRIMLNGIEPFTFLLYEKKCLYQFRWDGIEKYSKQLPASRPHIWSSATLYEQEAIKKREQWFASFLNRSNQVTQQDILHFHQFSGEGDRHTDLVMSRDNKYRTVSITGIHLTPDRGSIRHIAFPEGTQTEVKTTFINTQPAA